MSVVVDAHVHLWDPAVRTYPWMDQSVAPLQRAFSVDDLRAAMPDEVAGAIVVQAVSDLGETESLLDLAAASDTIIGVVGWVDLREPDVAETLADLRALPGGDKLVGIRHQVQDENDSNWLMRDDVRRGLAAVGACGLPYDLLVRTRELPAAIDAVCALPDVRFILDHAAKPPIATGEMEPWSTLLGELAGAPNVSCKLSGLVTEATWGAWSPDQIIPYARRVLEAFGPQRVLFGSDWPVALLAGSYAQVLALAREACAYLSADEHDAVFRANALRCYAVAGRSSVLSHSSTPEM